MSADRSPPLAAEVFLDIPAVARRLAVSSKTVRRLIARGELLVHQIGRQVRISEADFDKYATAQRRP